MPSKGRRWKVEREYQALPDLSCRLTTALVELLKAKSGNEYEASPAANQARHDAGVTDENGINQQTEYSRQPRL